MDSKPQIEDAAPVAEHTLSTTEILRKAEAKFAERETAQAFILRLFEKLAARAASNEFNELFDVNVIRHADYLEPTARAFVIKVLANEKRQDNFVSVTIEGAIKKREAAANFLARASGYLWGEEAEAANYKLSLNCQLDAVQVTITLTPKFKALKRFVLVVSCAPSLDCCYVMEMLTQHKLKDWNAFDHEGVEIVRRWYTKQWDDRCDSLVDNIFDKLRTVVQESVAATAQALSSK